MLQEEAFRVAVMCLHLNGILNKVVSCYNAHLVSKADSLSISSEVSMGNSDSCRGVAELSGFDKEGS